MADAAIGGKLGIDFQTYKNHIGVFALPLKTVIFPDFLKTLPERELRSGFAEVIKHCLLSDENEWNEIKKHDLKNQNWKRLIELSAIYKTKVTASDPKEKGERKLLNLGHTIGHALESFYLRTDHRIFHGEAIAMGLILESKIASRKKMLSEKAFEEIDLCLRKIYQPFMPLPAVSELMSVIRQDKKNKGDSILMALLTGIGTAAWDVEVSQAEIEESFNTF
ncbi:MAG: 3-dehydroquinate synthase [Candidatus Nephrothrix sp. EaCA]|nr:MAG: 3-dehydroquinate synthase [Candidatus Nephrothrix sp. EaCA]